MTQDAQKQVTQDTVDTTGLEDFWSCHDKTSHTDLTLEEAAVRLNLSERTIQRRLKQGHLKGYKISGPRGPEWRVQIESTDDMTQDTPSASQDKTMTYVGTTVVEPLSSQDKPDTEIAFSRAFAEVSEFYKVQIDTLHDKLESATFRNGYLEAQLSAAQGELKLLPDLSTKASRVEQLEEQVRKLETELAFERQGWLVRFSRWFIGKQ